MFISYATIRAVCLTVGGIALLVYFTRRALRSIDNDTIDRRTVPNPPPLPKLPAPVEAKTLIPQEKHYYAFLAEKKMSNLKIGDYVIHQQFVKKIAFIGQKQIITEENHEPIWEESVKLATKKHDYKVGDIVVVKKTNCSFNANDTMKIVKVNDYGIGFYDKGWFFDPENFKLQEVEPKFKKGDRVILNGGSSVYFVKMVFEERNEITVSSNGEGNGIQTYSLSQAKPAPKLKDKYASGMIVNIKGVAGKHIIESCDDYSVKMTNSELRYVESVITKCGEDWIGFNVGEFVRDKSNISNIMCVKYPLFHKNNDKAMVCAWNGITSFENYVENLELVSESNTFKVGDYAFFKYDEKLYQITEVSPYYVKVQSINGRSDAFVAHDSLRKIQVGDYFTLAQDDYNVFQVYEIKNWQVNFSNGKFTAPQTKLSQLKPAEKHDLKVGMTVENAAGCSKSRYEISEISDYWIKLNGEEETFWNPHAFNVLKHPSNGMFEPGDVVIPLDTNTDCKIVEKVFGSENGPDSFTAKGLTGTYLCKDFILAKETEPKFQKNDCIILDLGTFQNSWFLVYDIIGKAICIGANRIWKNGDRYRKITFKPNTRVYKSNAIGYQDAVIEEVEATCFDPMTGNEIIKMKSGMCDYANHWSICHQLENHPQYKVGDIVRVKDIITKKCGVVEAVDSYGVKIKDGKWYKHKYIQLKPIEIDLKSGQLVKVNPITNKDTFCERTSKYLGHGGYAEVIEVKDKVISLRLLGCSMNFDLSIDLAKFIEPLYVNGKPEMVTFKC